MLKYRPVAVRILESEPLPVPVRVARRHGLEARLRHALDCRLPHRVVLNIEHDKVVLRRRPPCAVPPVVCELKVIGALRDPKHESLTSSPSSAFGCRYGGKDEDSYGAT